MSGLVGAEVDGCSVSVSCECRGCCSGVVGRVGEKTRGEQTPESLLVLLSRLCEVTNGALGNGLIGNGMVSSAGGAVKLFNFPILCSKNRS